MEDDKGQKGSEDEFRRPLRCLPSSIPNWDRTLYPDSDTITEWPFDNAPPFDKSLVQAQYARECLSSFCGICFVVSGGLKTIFLKFIGHSMLDSVRISSVKTSILGL